MNVENTASGLIKQFGKERAIDHVEFVLSPNFKLSKPHLREFWREVLSILKEHK